MARNRQRAKQRQAERRDRPPATGEPRPGRLAEVDAQHLARLQPALLLKPGHGKKKFILFRWFDRGFGALTNSIETTIGTFTAQAGSLGVNLLAHLVREAAARRAEVPAPPEPLPAPLRGAMIHADAGVNAVITAFESNSARMRRTSSWSG